MSVLLKIVVVLWQLSLVRDEILFWVIISESTGLLFQILQVQAVVTASYVFWNGLKKVIHNIQARRLLF